VLELEHAVRDVIVENDVSSANVLGDHGAGVSTEQRSISTPFAGFSPSASMRAIRADGWRAWSVGLTQEQKREVESLREQRSETRRATVAAIEDILYEALPVLDHGFVRVIDYMGDDGAIVQAARVSYGRGTKKSRDDAGLINYLLRNYHTSPFEMCEIKLHVKLPIFVARQWIRHRTANVNEYSARYSILDREFYVPAAEHLASQSASNRQGRDAVLTGAEAERVFTLLREDAERCYEHYEEMLNETADGTVLDPSRSGLARELARMNLPVSFYTQWYWKTDLHNLLHFIRLRADAHAQYEIRAYATVLGDVVERWVPLTHEAFKSYRVGGAHLSEKALGVVRALLRGEEVTQTQSGLSAREWRELVETLGR
jgi:thymidylate synthase (FAD)